MTPTFRSSIADKKAFVQPLADKYVIDPYLIVAVIEQESSWYPYAAVYEEGFYKRYIESMRNINQTEAHMRATSWGLMQVMGETARELGFAVKDHPSLAELTIPLVGIEYGCKKLRRELDFKGGNESAALLAYNGGGDADYDNEVLARKLKLLKEV